LHGAGRHALARGKRGEPKARICREIILLDRFESCRAHASCRGDDRGVARGAERQGDEVIDVGDCQFAQRRVADAAIVAQTHQIGPQQPERLGRARNKTR
jgi:hypothetical protein